MKSMEIRKKFFDFFIKHGHTKVPSSSLIPAQDPTLLFTNAGMNQFKDIFLGKETRSYTRATSIQKCMRAGGKHNDLENVGFTNRHLTFFEMMGNFSFGDYFKKEAIEYAWEFLTRDMSFNPNTIYATVFREDNDAYEIWQKSIGLPKERIYRLDEADNFWQMGDIGPCGPCSEILIDRGTAFGCGKKSCAPGCACDRFLEVWNLVFMQYDRQADGTLKPLKRTGVDTGMGLERLCVIIQKKDSVFEIDIFANTIKKIEELTRISYANASPEIKAAFNVLADHVRASSFLIADGCTPSNEGRGYVLRKIIRRAALFAQKLTDKNIFPALAEIIIQDMGSIYPELIDAKKSIIHLLSLEIEKFAHNLLQGQKILENYFDQSKKNKLITGEQAFRLYDTFGFPLELTKIIAEEQNFTVDTHGFEQEMEAQRERSGGKITQETLEKVSLPDTVKTEFTGYTAFITESPIIALIEHGQVIKKVDAHQSCWIITEQSPFYVEKGGQVSDKGLIKIGDQEVPVEDLQLIGNAIAVKITAPTTIKVGDIVTSIVGRHYRLDIMNNHTATHLLQAALIKVLGKEVKQSGSLVHPDYLRFDFTYHKALTHDQVKQVEDIVNEKIRENIPLNIYCTTYQDAVNHGVTAIFGEKYKPDNVRVIEIPGFSMELCGGTHVHATGDIGCFKITEENALSAGQRRIVALTGSKAIALFQDSYAMIKKLCQAFKVQPHELVETIEKQRGELKETRTHIKQLKKQLWQTQLPNMLENTEEMHGIPVLFVALHDYAPDELKDMAQALLAKKSGLYFLYSAANQQCSFFVITSPEFSKKINLKELSSWLKNTFGLRGGGKETSLQGGGEYVEPAMLEKKLKVWINKI
jgi:alanyl-tRNA synthetase